MPPPLHRARYIHVQTIGWLAGAVEHIDHKPPSKTLLDEAEEAPSSRGPRRSNTM